MEKIWLKNYKPEIPAEIKLDDTTLVDLFNQACKQYATNRAVSCHKVALSFSEVKERSLRMAQALIDIGVNKGDRVALILPNCLQYPLTVFAVLLAGATVVNINPLYTPNEIEYVLKNSEPTVVVTLDMFSEKLNGFYNQFGIKHIISTKIADPYPTVKRSIINLLLRYVAKVNPKLVYQPLSWRTLMEKSSVLASPIAVTADDIAFIQYTGATTGHPKGAMLLHRNIASNIKQIFSLLDVQVDDMSKQVVISALPMYHIFSLTANFFTFFFHGSENVMVPNAKNIKDLVKTMNSTPFTVFNSLDTLYHKLLEYKPFINAKHPHFKYGICGGMAIRQSVAEHWYQHTGLVPTNCYGLTETSPCVSMNDLGSPFNGSVGYPVPSTEIDIRDITTATQSLAQGEIGVIMVRGPQVMAGYWRNPEQTKLTLSADGWLRTGDIGYVNPDGLLFISGRETEMVIVSGFNVYPAEVEMIIDQLPEIAEVAVVGYPDEESGEAVHAYIVLNAEHTLSVEQILLHCRKNLTRYKVPHFLTIVEELPKTLVGKIDKKALVAQYLTKNTQIDSKY